MAKEKTAVQFYYDYIELLNDLNDTQFRNVIEAMVIYEKTSKVVSLDPLSKMAFNFIKKRIDFDKEKYLNKCLKNKENIQNYWNERIRTNTNVNKCIRSDTKNTDKDMDKELDKDKDIDNKNNNSSCFIEAVEKEFLNITPIQYEMLLELQNQYGEQSCIEALKECSKNNVKTINYLRGVLKNLNNGNKKQSKEINPNWLNEEIKADKDLTEEEINEMKDLLKEFE